MCWLLTRAITCRADMLEALCRLADLSSTPSGVRLKKHLREKDFVKHFTQLDIDGYSACR
jgi:hypothetical protein